MPYKIQRVQLFLGRLGLKYHGLTNFQANSYSRNDRGDWESPLHPGTP